MRRPVSRRRLEAALLAAGLAASAGAEEVKDLTQLTLEQLMSLEVTSLSRAPERTFTAPAAVAIVTGEQIRRAGVTSIPEALRMVPGIHVARLSSSQWSVGIRGFGSRLSRSMLVMIDGRTVYTPLFAGTYWEVQDVPLEDIDRIEVVRGPGGALWGANAVNGVIHIITKNAKDTQGLLASVGGGSEERGFTTLRYGGAAGALSYRLYGKYFDRDASHSLSANEFDGWRSGQSGFRADWDAAPDRTLTVQGDAYRTFAGGRESLDTYTPPYFMDVEEDAVMTGANLLARWSQGHSPGSRMSVQMFYDRAERDDLEFDETRDTADLDFQHAITWSRQEVTYGLGYRLVADKAMGVPTLTVHPSRRTDQLMTAFLQDQITLAPKRLSLTLGVKAERNDYTGWELQPSGRLLYTPTESQTLWTAVSRAVRTPSRVEHDIDATLLQEAATPTFLRLVAYPDFTSERVIAYEAGYRVAYLEKFLTGLAAFYNEYDDYSSFRLGAPFAEGANVIVPVETQNATEGAAWGGEIATVFNPFPGWRPRAAYSFVRINLDAPEELGDVFTEPINEGGSPRHQFLLQFPTDLPGDWELNPWLRYASGLPAQNTPAYWTMDLRVGWRGMKDWEFSVVGQNLLQKRHREGGFAAEVQRGFYVKATWRVP